MTEKSYGWSTGTTNDGASTYTQQDYADQFRVLSACLGFEGVAPLFLNVLAVTGVASPVSINTGGAMVDGHPYYNSASVTVVIPTPATLTRIDRIVLRADWANHLVRITRIAGTEGGGAPAITQTSGTTYDIKLAQVSITTGGVITVTNETTLSNGPFPFSRQGGHATAWSTGGSTNYPLPAKWGMQFGSGVGQIAGQAISFQTAFSDNPLVIVGSSNDSARVAAAIISASGFTLFSDVNGITCSWLAIGQLP